jgi:hypothetical protein
MALYYRYQNKRQGKGKGEPNQGEVTEVVEEHDLAKGTCQIASWVELILICRLLLIVGLHFP